MGDSTSPTYSPLSVAVFEDDYFHESTESNTEPTDVTNDKTGEGNTPEHLSHTSQEIKAAAKAYAVHARKHMQEDLNNMESNVDEDDFLPSHEVIEDLFIAVSQFPLLISFFQNSDIYLLSIIFCIHDSCRHRRGMKLMTTLQRRLKLTCTSI